MKIAGIIILMLGLLMALSLSMDILSGADLKRALLDMISPLQVMELIELIIFGLYFLLLIIQPIFSFYRKRKQKKAV
ncbi:hypothetical protein F9802_08100 [Bacillus aerolatus]|uniref:Uncharacterized protein n=1 Tax=Bacillus aerolatus TaxID=2653354 RepID=A0A6I1FQY6_9BACI|nr:hypothetical protein [Bacillus aerolatus]KAB7706978.1 hypothetical protein F9802_08100 [Bacillus aerolatus]